LRDDQLVSDPFFIPGPQELHDGSGGKYAADHRNTLLAEMIPGRTLPCGGYDVAKFTQDAGEQRNFDMMALESGWPQERLNNNNQRNRWLHSDMNNVAYPFIWRLFDRITKLGALDP
jgi:hypothetical protein